MLSIVRVKGVPLVRKLHFGRMVPVLEWVVMLSSPVMPRHALVGARLPSVNVLLVSCMNSELVLGLVHIVMSGRLVLCVVWTTCMVTLLWPVMRIPATGIPFFREF